MQARTRVSIIGQSDGDVRDVLLSRLRKGEILVPILTDREAFEKYASGTWLDLEFNDGDYEELPTRIASRAYQAGLSAGREQAAQLDIKEIILEHETNYVHRGEREWDWSCVCGATRKLHERVFCVDMTAAHWADEIKNSTRTLGATQPEVKNERNS